jgi:hypothetical protein
MDDKGMRLPFHKDESNKTPIQSGKLRKSTVESKGHDYEDGEGIIATRMRGWCREGTGRAEGWDIGSWLDERFLMTNKTQRCHPLLVP